MSIDSAETPYANLSPDRVCDALDTTGLLPTGGLLALNSYENRVYQAELDDGSFVVTKFYRPGRWSEAQLREEHEFVQELVDHELPCVAPLSFDGDTLMHYEGYWFVVYPRQGGHTPDIEREEDLKVLARTLGRIHAVGKTRRFTHRITLDVDTYAASAREFLLTNNFIPMEMLPAYESVSADLIARLRTTLENLAVQRIHGDCHLGNLLWRNDTPHFVDFDDTLTGPCIQDLWMLLSGSRDEQQRQLQLILEAYSQFCEFDYSSLASIEALRSLRLMYHAGWLARRWNDPAFPLAFPWFNTQRYWADHVLTLREQMAALDEPPLAAG